MAKREPRPPRDAAGYIPPRSVGVPVGGATQAALEAYATERVSEALAEQNAGKPPAQGHTSDEDFVRRGDALDAAYAADSLELASHGEGKIIERIMALPAHGGATPKLPPKPTPTEWPYNEQKF